MKTVIRNISYLLLSICMIGIFSGCNNEDDVINIFVGKTWKLSFIAIEGSYQQFDFWNGNSDAREKSMKLLAGKGNFILNFEGADINGTTGGSFNAKVTAASIEGLWNANGKNQALSLSNVKVTGSESDVFGKAFIKGIQEAFKYEGDINNLFIYYKDGATVKRLGFKPQR